MGNCLEFGYGFEVADFEVAASVVHIQAEVPGDGKTEVYIGIHYAFDLMSQPASN